MVDFFDEVKRRKVYRVAVAYVVVGGGIIQLASATFPAWDLPSWALRLVIILLLIGFPIALILAWAFDVTPQGIRTTEPAAATSEQRGRRNLLILLATGVLVSGGAGFFVLPHAFGRKMEKSIAVLPFESYSEGKENAFFADGIQDDILTNLAKIGDLKVISRTSVMGYRGKPESVREIGKTLGVSAILEGSVRRSENRVRVNVQLIDARTDKHLWAEEYDRDLTDMFAIQTDLAQKIARELQAKLSPSEKARMTRRPTENGEAYLAFLHAHNSHSALDDFAKLKEGEQLYERALQLDANFALATAGLAQLEIWIFHAFDPSPLRRDKAVALATRALQLQPDLPEAHLARGFCYYYADRDYESALREFRTAQSGLPNASEIYLAIGAIQRRQGKWDESTANLEKAASLDPNSAWALQNLAINYEMLRRADDALGTLDRAFKIAPKSFSLWALKAQLAIQLRGDFSVAERGFEIADAILQTAPSPGTSGSGGQSLGFNASHYGLARMNVFVLQRKFQETLREAAKIDDAALPDMPDGVISKYLFEGLARANLRDEAGARGAFTKARELAQSAVAQAPDKAALQMQLALALAYLGEKEKALTEAKRGSELLPERIDTFEGPQITEALAEVYAILGDADHAIPLLDGLLARPSSVTVPLLKIHPAWDRIRDHPQFAALLAKYGG